MAVLLAVVGSLQYRWAREETAATESRLGTTIESMMVDWDEDFYRQFSDICVALQVGPDSGMFDDWAPYRSRYIRWRAESRYPGMIRKLYIWETSDAGVPRLFDLEEDRPLPVQVYGTPPLLPLLQRLRSRSANLRAGLEAWKLNLRSSEETHPPSPYSSLSGWQFDPELPALVHPIVHHAIPGDSGRPARSRAIDWIVILLDFPTIRDRILPELTQKYFKNGLYGPVDISVAALGFHPRLLYKSNPDSQISDGGNPGATLNIFGLTPQSTEGHLWEAVKNANSVAPQDWRKLVGPVWFPIIRYTPHQDNWTLALQSPIGPLDGVVQRVRRENMFVSFAVLVLLAVNMSLIAISSYRSSRFAQLQMDFVASMSHELRTPLAALLSAGENIRDGVVDNKDQLRRYGGIVTAQAQQLISLLDQILAFASMRSGTRQYRKSIFPVGMVVDSIVRSNDSLLHKRGFTVERRIPGHLPDAKADPEATAQCLQNLLTNATKYSGSSRRIIISASAINNRVGTFVAVSVQDFGIGIARPEIPLVFKPFYRSSSVVEAQIHGTGLGLPLARRIAEDMGGSLSVDSRLGAGSTFTLHLPAAEEGGVSVTEARRIATDEREHFDY